MCICYADLMNHNQSSIPAGRAECPKCGNKIGVRITPEGARMALHRKAKDSAEICGSKRIA